MPPYKPTRKEIHEAYGKKVPDLIARDLRVLFCGIIRVSIQGPQGITLPGRETGSGGSCLQQASQGAFSPPSRNMNSLTWDTASRTSWSGPPPAPES